jgi:hypothetical protein
MWREAAASSCKEVALMGSDCGGNFKIEGPRSSPRYMVGKSPAHHFAIGTSWSGENMVPLLPRGEVFAPRVLVAKSAQLQVI